MFKFTRTNPEPPPASAHSKKPLLVTFATNLQSHSNHIAITPLLVSFATNLKSHSNHIAITPLLVTFATNLECSCSKWSQ